MSQLVACAGPSGLLLASDRLVVAERRGAVERHSVRKLFPLGPTAAVATSGAAVGIAVSRTLSRLLSRRGSLPLSELAAYVLGVFQKEYDEFVRQGASWFAEHPEAHRLSYVLIGGRDRDELTYRFYASEAHGEPYRLLPTAHVLTAPRRLGLEARLDQTAARGASLGELRQVAVSGLQVIAEREDSVAGPFDVASIDPGGVRVETVE